MLFILNASLSLPSYDSETVDSFHKNLTTTGARLAPISRSAPPGPRRQEESPSAVARKMIEDERDSAVFRQGDYNVTRKCPLISQSQRWDRLQTDIRPTIPKDYIYREWQANGRFGVGLAVWLKY